MTETYDASHITVLEGLQPVRERPAMYIGSTDTRGLHHLVYEVVDNSIDEALAGFCNRISVVINKDGSLLVEDNGRGIPVDTMEKNHKSALEVVLTVLHAGGKFDKETYQVSGGLHGVGVSVVNALSNWLSAQVYRDGNIYEMRFSKGKTTSPLTTREETLVELLARYQQWYGEPAPFARASPALAASSSGAIPGGFPSRLPALLPASSISQLPPTIPTATNRKTGHRSLQPSATSLPAPGSTSSLMLQSSRPPPSIMTSFPTGYGNLRSSTQASSFSSPMSRRGLGHVLLRGRAF